ncbi:MAG TPA: DUF58 domain-containing protein [Gemmataceae bacterium]|jgi:uncharacterized protein (DUF58 family)|nr:DUF58 domain-containing protein [Gemmataceae bacterium]
MSTGLDRAARELVDPQLFAALEDLELIARTAVEGFLQGLHRSPYVGFSVEFASHREYLPGDDLRHLNWKLYGRQDKLYVKQYDAETNLDLHLLVDWSGSMNTRSGRLSKQRYAACLAAALAHLALKQRDAVGLTLFAGGVLDHLRPRAKASQLDELLHALTRTPLRPRAESVRVLHEIAELMPRRGLVVLVSDLFYDSHELFAGLDHFRFAGHDVLLLQVLDPLERNLPLAGAIRFHDLETGEELVTQAQDIRPAYEAAIRDWFGELEQGCLTREIERVALTTDEPLAQALYAYLAQRAQHG